MRERMKWAFFGSSLLSAYWNGAATYYRGIIRALSALGHDVTFYEPDAYDRQRNRDIDAPEWAKVRVYQSDLDSVHAMLDEAASADVIVKASGVGVFDAELEAGVLSLKRPGNLILFWDVDAPATIERIALHTGDPFRSLVSRYDLILTYGGGDPVVSRYLEFGARGCIPVYNALDRSTHFPVERDPRFTGLLGFLGNRLPDRETRVEDFFLSAARELPDARFVLGGNGWSDKPMPSNVRYIGHVFTHQHNAFNSSVHAVLNLSRESMAAYGFSPATRVFEAAGAAACLITDAWEGIEKFFEPGTEILVARDSRELISHLNDLTPEHANSVGQAAYRRVCAEHTYDHRARQVHSALVGRNP